MEFKDTPEEAAFRTEVRSFIKSNLPADWQGGDEMIEEAATPTGREREAFRGQWRRSLGAQRWIAPHWPKEYGGAGMSPGEQFIFNEEMAEARAPQVGGMGVTMIGPTLILYGTDEQKAEHLPKITSGEVQWAQGYSEPGAGSDLASLQTRAIRDGDDYVINGQKIWSSGAHRADWMFMLTRTDPEAPKHRGISMLLVDLKSPGIQIQPLIDMSGGHVFNQEYFDNVRVPARNRVGEENRGWYVGATLLDFERSGIGGSISLRHQVGDLVTFARQASTSGPVPVRMTDTLRAELAERAVEAEIAKLISYRLISIQKRGQVPNYEASMNKNFRAEASQRLAQTGIKLLGLYGNVYGDGRLAAMKGRLTRHYLSSVSATIAAGTSEINRNVIATRGLGLPRG
ncbi:MAG: acyl-CoA dehydrogenase family protein [Chloroflexi bacterium]|nr:acyl-CoA dehydrogenase family protein [Chloroflexota bacterium]